MKTTRNLALPVLFLILTAGMLGPVLAQEPEAVTIAGSFQSELACPDDWQPDCTNTHLSYDEADGVWQAIFAIPAGSYEYKATLNNAWDESYGQNGGSDNIALALAQETEVKFYYDHASNWVTDNQNALIVTAPGNYQQAMGCPEDWDPACLRSWLQDVDGDGIYTLQTSDIPQGSYECKAAINENWDLNYGGDGEIGGSNIAFSVPFSGAQVTFSFDSSSNILTVDSDGEPPQDPGYAIIHYYRQDGDYGDHTTGDSQDFWGLHLWGDAIDPTEATDWASPKPFLGESSYGRFAYIKLSGNSGPLNFIVHRGDAKDGGDEDRAMNPSSGREIWLKQDSIENFTSHAGAMGYATIHYHREDGNYGEGTADYWGVHIWSDGGANAIDPSAETTWEAPRPPDGFDDFGAYFNIPLNLSDPAAASKPLKFIIHTPSGDDTSPDGNREPGGDRQFIPLQTSDAWIVRQDETVHASQGAAQKFAILHYHREDGDYGDAQSDDFNNFWGLHLWDGSASPTEWSQPLKPEGSDSFGVWFKIDILDDATQLSYILHRGDAKDPGPDQSLNLATTGHEAWQLNNADVEKPYVYPLPSDSSAANPGNLAQQRAYWVDEHTIAWDMAGASAYYLVYSPDGGLEAGLEGVTGGSQIALTLDPNGLPPSVLSKFPHLSGLASLKIDEADAQNIPGILQGQAVVSALNENGESLNATGLQLPGVLDDLFAYQGTLGLEWAGTTPSFTLWAPTAKSVAFHLYDAADAGTASQSIPMTRDGSVWRATGQSDWKNKFYLYEVEVYVSRTDAVEHNMVTDPYSLNLSENSGKTQIIDLNDAIHKPQGWATLQKPFLAAPEDIVIYEMHLRDFSVNDPTVPQIHKGKYKAFTYSDTNGANHLEKLQAAGLTHLHLLPVFDIATINENQTQRQEPDPQILADFAPDSAEQQALIVSLENQDAFNWGYDPYHYTVPEGSYATSPETRILEFREMVDALNRRGLRVVMDVVYNHTNASGQNEKSVLDKIVPGYYHRLNEVGNVENSTCCDNTASEHAMMEKLMVDSLVVWARDYKVDAFRFDLMGHHMVSNMQAVQQALGALTLETDGVDGSKIYLYGEGWNFGEVANGARGENAIQHHVGGLGIGTFNDRLRDAVRGGGPFDDGQQLKRQGFGNGLFTNPNDLDQGDQLSSLLQISDWVRIGLAGNLADYQFEDRNGNLSKGSEIDYNGQEAGYTQDPQEVITYVSKHDNQTLYDINIYGAPISTGMPDRVRMQILGLSTVALAQGVPFFHAGSDLLRSKSLDRDSFNSGDWFNRLDFTYQSNYFGAGLPVAGKNESNWDIMAPLLANPSLKPEPEDIAQTAALFQELLRIRKSSKLFRLETKDDIINRLTFLNTGPDQIPGLIVMHLSDEIGPDLDPLHDSISVLFNGDKSPQSIVVPELVGQNIQLHPVQIQSADPVVQSASFDPATGTFLVPPLTTAVFVELAPAGSIVNEIRDLQDQINQWVENGILNNGQGQRLQAWLNNAIRSIQFCQFKLAANFVDRTRKELETYVSNGVLTQQQADPLYAQIQVILAQLASH